MTKQHEHEQQLELARLARLLEAFGSRPERWPANARAVGVATSPLARALIDDARALDRALATAVEPVVAADRALADRIAAAAFAVEPAANPQPSGQVIALPRRPRPAAVAGIERVGPRRMAASLVAACLLGGIMLGGVMRLDHVLQDVADSIGLPAEFVSTTTALAEEVGEEDTL